MEVMDQMQLAVYFSCVSPVFDVEQLVLSIMHSAVTSNRQAQLLLQYWL